MRHSVIALSLAGTLAAPLGAQQPALPAGAEGARARLDASPRHGEWVRFDAGGGDSVRMWVVYPERSDRAPVVIVIQEIFGLTDWIRGVADELAAEGFIALAPDLLSGKGPNGGGSEVLDQQASVAVTRTVTPDERVRRLVAAARYGSTLPAARSAVGVIGFCWGGESAFHLATTWADLRAAVVYYGTSPAESLLGRVRAPVLGLYAGDDARVNTTVPPAQAEMRRLGKRYDVHAFDGAGHGFLRNQAARDGANLRATERSWPLAVGFLRETLGQ